MAGTLPIEKNSLGIFIRPYLINKKEKLKKILNNLLKYFFYLYILYQKYFTLSKNADNQSRLKNSHF